VTVTSEDRFERAQNQWWATELNVGGLSYMVAATNKKPSCR